jgi:predicted unusual protein kinase regulating ubiquinone biosynthesis (AarF/ABC1/UbiB family)
MQGVLDALRKHHVRVDGNYATSVVNLLCIESIAAALDPTYNLLDESEALLTAHTVRSHTCI